MTIDLFMFIVTLMNGGLVLINLGILGLAVKLYTDQTKQRIFKEKL